MFVLAESGILAKHYTVGSDDKMAIGPEYFFGKQLKSLFLLVYSSLTDLFAD